MEASIIDLRPKHILVTGGAGFFGQHVVRALRDRGCEQIAIPRRRDYDLMHEVVVERLCLDAYPRVVIHWRRWVASRPIAGIQGGSSTTMPYRGVRLAQYGRRFGVEKMVLVGTVCAYPKFTPLPFREGDLCNSYPEQTNAPYGVAKKIPLVQAKACPHEYGFNAIYLLHVNL